MPLICLSCSPPSAQWLSWTMVKPDIHTLAHHLKQERLYVASEKQLIQRLNNEVLKTAERLYRAAWIAKQQRINLDRLILTRWLHTQTSKTSRLSSWFSFMTHYLINWTGRIAKITLWIISVVETREISFKVFDARNIFYTTFKFVQDSHFYIQLGIYKLVLNNWLSQLTDSI